jgi:hypothetical protein
MCVCVCACMYVCVCVCCASVKRASALVATRSPRYPNARPAPCYAGPDSGFP